MNLPKLYRVVDIEFWGLRPSLGSSLGVIYDNDVKVKRKAMLALVDGLPRWRIKSARGQCEWDYVLESDQECLDCLYKPSGILGWN